MSGDGATKDNVKTVLVRQGDYLAKLAYAHNLTPEDLWDDPANEGLRTLRPDPNLLAPGDSISIPVKPRAALPIQKGTNNRYTVTVPRVAVTIRFGADDGRFAKAPFLLHGAATSPDATTDDEGTVTVSIPVHAASFDVEFPELGKRFTVLVGHLDPVSTPAGARARMVQLGYFLPPASAAFGPDLLGERPLDEDLLMVGAIRDFQRDHELPPTGELCEATRAALVLAI